MTGLDLRPLSLGEILDRTFSLYRRHFLLFVGISAIPQVLVVAFSLAQILYFGVPGARRAGFLGGSFVLALAFVVLSVVAYLFSQGGTILAVSELYLGRPTSISQSLRRVWDEFGSLFGVIMLNGLAVIGAFLLFIIPGIYVMCRLIVCLPAALVERRGPRESLSRSFELTRGFAGRAFVILLLYFVLDFALQMCVAVPFGVGVAIAAGDPGMLRILNALSQVGQAAINALVGPILLIATSVFYFDLRVRKEAFDLQFMMDPTSASTTRSSSVPSILS